MLVLIVNSSLQVAERLQELLSEEESISTIHNVVSYEESAHFIKKIKPAVVLLDSGLPANGSVNLLKKLNAETPEIPVIVLSNNKDDYSVRNWRSHGAHFIFDKYHEFEKIPGTINKIATDKKNNRL